MANPFAPHDTYDVTITDPQDGEEWTVTLRILNAGDRAVLQDQLRVEMAEDGETEVARVPMGTVRMLTVSRAVVRWTLPVQATPATIAQLRDELFEQIFEACRFAAAAAEEDEEEKTPTEAIEEALGTVDPTDGEEALVPDSPEPTAEPSF